MNRIILFCPFIPFIVLFCSSIEQGNLEDIQLIEQFGKSLEPCRKLSNRVENLFQLCQALNNLTRAFVQAKTSSQHHVQSDRNSFPDFSIGRGHHVQPLNIDSVDHRLSRTIGLQAPYPPQEAVSMSSGLCQGDLQIFDIMNIMDTGDLISPYNNF